jgi:cob(I)alamin adenosyltransferase
MASVSGAKQPLEFLEHETKLLENEIDAQTKMLPELRRFILPQGTLAGAHAHVARTVCRRAERQLVTIAADMAIRQYINRLSDYLFTLARTLSRNQEVFA